MEIFIPEQLRLREVLGVCRQIKDVLPGTQVSINFGRMGKIGPFAMLMISSTISRTRSAKQDITFQPRNYSHLGYCSHMGFFRACGFQYGNIPGGAAGSFNYLPVTLQATTNIHTEVRDSGRPVGELVEAEAASLAEILSRSRSGDIFDVLMFALREIIRNTYEHSRSLALEYCAQYNPLRDRVEIAIIDRGIGIYKSLSTNTTLNIKDERHAINMSLLPGISKNVRQDTGDRTVTDIWGNSGFGLFMTQRMCRFGGDFFLASGASGRYIRDDNARWFDFGFEGTAVRMVLEPSRIGSLKAALAEFDKQGKEIARQNKIKIPNASTASRMVRLGLYNPDQDQDSTSTPAS